MNTNIDQLALQLAYGKGRLNGIKEAGRVFVQICQEAADTSTGERRAVFKYLVSEYSEILARAESSES